MPLIAEAMNPGSFSWCAKHLWFFCSPGTVGVNQRRERL